MPKKFNSRKFPKLAKEIEKMANQISKSTNGKLSLFKKIKRFIRKKFYGEDHAIVDESFTLGSVNWGGSGWIVSSGTSYFRCPWCHTSCQIYNDLITLHSYVYGHHLVSEKISITNCNIFIYKSGEIIKIYNDDILYAEYNSRHPYAPYSKNYFLDDKDNQTLFENDKSYEVVGIINGLKASQNSLILHQHGLHFDEN